MKVKELIAALQQQDQEAEVVYLNDRIDYELVGGVFVPQDYERPFVEECQPQLAGYSVVGLG